MLLKKYQVGLEYMIIIGFVSFAIVIILLAAYSYMGIARDKIKMNQIEVLANKIISASESVFFAGYPSKAEISVYMPKNVKNITLDNNYLIIEMETSSGNIIRSFKSRVPMSGNIDIGEGTKKLTITAQQDYVSIT